MKRIDRQRGEPAARQRATQPKLKGTGKKSRDRPDDAGARPANGVALSNKDYAKQLKRLHIELVRLQEWVKHKGLKVCIVFEGRDGAGKGGTIKAITDRVSPRVFRVVALPAPTERQKTQMYLQRYIRICRPPARSSSSTAAGTTAQGSSA